MSNSLDGLNEAQLGAVTHESGPLLIVAGAGTGKTTVLARRYVWLLEGSGSGAALKTENILALTFTDKSAEEMEDRVLQLLPNGTYDFWISTFHGFCQRILEERGLEIGLPNRFRVLNETDAWLLLKRRINELPLDHYRPLGNPVKFLASLLTHISRAKDEGISVEQYLEFAQNLVLDGDQEFVTGERKRLQELADCYAAYRKILRDEGALDFGDLIVETLRLLRERPAVLKEYRERFKMIMVDEFQDTNWAQYELVKLLAGPEQNITVVGDDDQAIYKFRGASLANILQFRDDFPSAKTILLTQNYRSNQEILDTAYGFIQKNDPYRLEVKLAGTGLQKKLTAARGEGGSVSALWYRSMDEEAEAVAERIQELKDADPELKWNDIAILSRSNDGAIPFIQALDRHGVPYRFYALRGLYAKPLVIDLMSLLSLCDGYHESTAVWRVLTMSCYGFTAREVAEFLQYATRKGVPVWIALKQAATMPGITEETLKKTHVLVAHVESLAESARRDPPLKIMQFALEKTGYLSDILKRPEDEKMESLNVLNTFANRIKRYELSTHGPTLRGFLEELKLEIDSGEEGALNVDPESGPELVKVMTIHASKGLEFRHVFVVSLVDQRFPTRERHDAIPLPDGLVNERLPEGDAHLEEERRLFYVAMTRAKDTLTLTGAAEYGGTRKKKPSVFLEEAKVAVKDQAIADGDLLSLTPADVISQKEIEEKAVFQLKRRFSFTQLAAFRKCPLQYKFAHIYRIPILGSYHKSFGQAMHLTLHDVLKAHTDRGNAQQGSLFGGSSVPVTTTPGGFRVSLDEVLETYEARWAENDQWYPDQVTYEKYKKEGREALKRLWQEWSAKAPTIHGLEIPFDWRIGDHSLKGSVDRIDALPDGGFAIFDYKTGEGKTSENLETGDKEQLRIYQLAMEERGLSVKRLAYIYLRTGEQAEVDLLQGEKRETFKAEIKRRMDEILASRFAATPSPFICKYCDFRNVCEFRKL